MMTQATLTRESQKSNICFKKAGDLEEDKQPSLSLADVLSLEKTANTKKPVKLEKRQSFYTVSFLRLLCTVGR